MEMISVPLLLLTTELRSEGNRPGTSIANNKALRMIVQPGIDITGRLERP